MEQSSQQAFFFGHVLLALDALALVKLSLSFLGEEVLSADLGLPLEAALEL